MISLDLEDHCAIGKYHKVLHTVCTKYSQSEPPWFVYIKVILQWILIEHLGNPPPLSCYCFQIHWCCLSMSLVLLEIVSGSERELIMINEDLGASLLTFIKFSDTSHYCSWHIWKWRSFQHIIWCTFANFGTWFVSIGLYNAWCTFLGRVWAVWRHSLGMENF